jgi:hypothetical protein
MFIAGRAIHKKTVKCYRYFDVDLAFRFTCSCDVKACPVRYKITACNLGHGAVYQKNLEQHSHVVPEPVNGEVVPRRPKQGIPAALQRRIETYMDMICWMSGQGGGKIRALLIREGMTVTF